MGFYESIDNACDMGSPVDVSTPAPELVLTFQRPMPNFFLKGLLSSNSLVVFHLSKTPNITSISIGKATDLYVLQDFWLALGDFSHTLSHQQRRGRWVFGGCPDVGFDHIRIWS